MVLADGTWSDGDVDTSSLGVDVPFQLAVSEPAQLKQEGACKGSDCAVAPLISEGTIEVLRSGKLERSDMAEGNAREELGVKRR